MEMPARAAAMALTIVVTAVATSVAPTLGGASIPRLGSHAVDGSAGVRTAFVRAHYRWPRGRIPYYNAARANRWPIRRAVRAWNASGAGVRFVAVPRRRAKVVIRYHRSRKCEGVGYAVVDFARGVAIRGDVAISRPDPGDPACARWALAMVAAHELGHVLGLEHEHRRCATMNATIMGFGPGRCDPTAEWEWRCRLLERDDVRGAVRLYGGRVRARPRPTCDIFAPPQPPADIAVDPSTEIGSVEVTFGHPVDPPAPRHLPAAREGYAFAARRGRCPEPAEAPASPWAVPSGARQRELFSPGEPGPYCFAAWTLDAAGRLSPPVTSWVDVEFSPGGELVVTPL
jgi:hypothetical protein